MCQVAKMMRTVEESRALNALRYPAVIVSASGMATGGRVLHHLKALGPDRRNTIVFVGYRAGGTRGARLLAGERSIRIHGEPGPADALRQRIERELGWPATVPRLGQSVEIA